MFFFQCCHEKIWNNYIKMQWKSMQVIFIMFWCMQGYKSLGDPTRQHEVWRKMLLHVNITPKQKHLQRIFFLTKSAAVCLYYLGFWAFSPFKSMYINNTLKWTYAANMCNASWVISNMAASTKQNVYDANISTLKEYEIITWYTTEKTCRLDLLR